MCNSFLSIDDKVSGFLSFCLYYRSFFHQVLRSESLTCEDVLKPFDWLLDIETIGIQGLTSMICDNGTDLQQAVLMVLMPLIESVRLLLNFVIVSLSSDVILNFTSYESDKIYTRVSCRISTGRGLQQHSNGRCRQQCQPPRDSLCMEEDVQQHYAVHRACGNTDWRAGWSILDELDAWQQHLWCDWDSSTKVSKKGCLVSFQSRVMFCMPTSEQNRLWIWDYIFFKIFIL